MKRAWGNSTDTVLALLAGGPKSARQLRQATGLGMTIISGIMARLLAVQQRGTTPGQRRAHIAGWTRHDDARHQFYVPVYGLGDLPDKPKPAPKPRQAVNREYWQRRKQRREQFGPGADLQAVWHEMPK